MPQDVRSCSFSILMKCVHIQSISRIVSGKLLRVSERWRLLRSAKFGGLRV
jgi:hypothetical protein